MRFLVICLWGLIALFYYLNNNLDQGFFLKPTLEVAALTLTFLWGISAVINNKGKGLSSSVLLATSIHLVVFVGSMDGVTDVRALGIISSFFVILNCCYHTVKDL